MVDLDDAWLAKEDIPFQVLPFLQEHQLRQLALGPSQWRHRLQFGQTFQAQLVLNPNFPPRGTAHAKVETVVLSTVSYPRSN